MSYYYTVLAGIILALLLLLLTLHGERKLNIIHPSSVMWVGAALFTFVGWAAGSACWVVWALIRRVRS